MHLVRLSVIAMLLGCIIRDCVADTENSVASVSDDTTLVDKVLAVFDEPIPDGPRRIAEQNAKRSHRRRKRRCRRVLRKRLRRHCRRLKL